MQKNIKKPTEDFVKLVFNTSPLKVNSKLESVSDVELMKEPVFWLLPFEKALKKGGDYTRYILSKIAPQLKHDTKYIFVDLKIQQFKAGNVPTELSGCFWHVDAPIMVPELYSSMLGSKKLIDILASRQRESPRLFSFLTQELCATQFIKENNITLELPKCIDGFQELSDKVNEKIQSKECSIIDHQALCWVNFDSSHLHRARAAEKDCVRLWCRVSETNILPVDRILPINATFEMENSIKNLL